MAREKIRIQVKPGSRKGPLVELGPDNTYTVYVTARAVDGAANEAVILALADYFGLRKRQLEITAGHTARYKTVTIYQD